MGKKRTLHFKLKLVLQLDQQISSFLKTNNVRDRNYVLKMSGRKKNLNYLFFVSYLKTNFFYIAILRARAIHFDGV